MEAAISKQQMSSADAIWTLFQAQTKAVRKIITKRIIALDKEERERVKAKSNAPSSELLAKLDSIRQEMKDGQCTVCNTQEELDSFFDSL